MKKILVRVLTEEYEILVILGSQKSLAKFSARYIRGWSYEELLDYYATVRGATWNTLPKRNILIAIKSDLPVDTALATLSHEASHAADYISNYLRIEDKNGEFKAHCISGVMRQCLTNISAWRKSLRGRKNKLHH